MAGFRLGFWYKIEDRVTVAEQYRSGVIKCVVVLSPKYEMNELNLRPDDGSSTSRPWGTVRTSRARCGEHSSQRGSRFTRSCYRPQVEPRATYGGR